MKGNFYAFYNISFQNNDKIYVLNLYPYTVLSETNEDIHDFFIFLREDIIDSLQQLDIKNILYKCYIHLNIFYEYDDKSGNVLEHYLQLKAINIFSKTKTIDKIKRYIIGRKTDSNPIPKKICSLEH